ncbi:MAG: DUF72 domain-containing protein [Candidatus Aegiribacteria sp.]|nr:DUF72 domain-containing protein [Candidatus Aegiribacteria sp.]
MVTSYSEPVEMIGHFTRGKVQPCRFSWNDGALRYDYTYSDEELQAWLPAISRSGAESGKIFVMFNNCHFGQAVR